MTNLSLNLNPAETALTFVQDGKVLTDSRTVAATFGKEHRNVLAAVKRLGIPADFNALNFKPVEYTDEKGERRPCYHITRDGFVLLVMGFTGKKAMEFKIKYIEAFNAMERALEAQPAAAAKPVTVSEHTRALPSGKKEIVLSEKAKQEIGGIVKACLGTSGKTSCALDVDVLKNLIREVLREELAGFLLKDGVTATEPFNGNVTADGLPAANWALSIVHGASALQYIIGQLTDKQKEAVKLLA